MNIRIVGAREHNLNDVDVEFGRGLTAVTGVSGSGKTSLVFDTLYQEARRRFLEVYALGSVNERPNPAAVETITGLGPAVALGQNLLNRNPNSTLASATGLSPFLRLLYARFGRRQCPDCGQELILWSADELIERLQRLAGSEPLTVSAPLFSQVMGSHRTLLQLIGAQFGKDALQVDGRPFNPERPLDPTAAHDLAVIIGVLNPQGTADQARELLNTARALGAVAVRASSPVISETLALAPVCARCGRWFTSLEPVDFHRPCPHCMGSGCEACLGSGLTPAAAAVTWDGLNLPAFLSLAVATAGERCAAADLPFSAARLLQEISRRLAALSQVGLDYLQLNRPSPTLSRGEAQRARLAVTLTSRLEDLLHIFDEPTIGQHPADTARFLPVLRSLPGPVIYVEHDRSAVAVADQVVDLGPGAGEQGGRVIFQGPPAALWAADTPSGRYFSGRTKLSLPVGKPAPAEFLRIKGAHLHNLQGIDVPIPLQRLTAVCGVSGSGKSTLIEGVLLPSLEKSLPVGCLAFEGQRLQPLLVDQSPIGRNPRSNPATYTQLAGIIRDLFAQAGGLTPSHFSFNRPDGACPACAGMGAVEIKMRYLPSTWIQCAACEGQRFKDEVLAVRVDFNGHVYSIADFYRLSVSELLQIFAQTPWLPKKKRQDGLRFLRALRDVGLGYISLGQPSPSLSGGEAQRVKLAKFLGRPSLRQQLLILDEPTTGLHPADIAGLLGILDRLVKAGGTVVFVEHNLDLLRAADWIVELGPGAGPHGGRLLYSGPPAGLAELPGSPTGSALRADSDGIPALQSQVRADPNRRAGEITIHKAQVHNLQGVSVSLPKNALTVITGVSGSGKSTLVHDVLEVEARRRFLETLSLYERQGTREEAQADVEEISGLGVTIAVAPDQRRFHDQRATVGTATEIAHHLAVLLSWCGARSCADCGQVMDREMSVDFHGWRCPNCGATAVAEPRYFSPFTYAAVCLTCNGVGTLQIPNPGKLIVDPDKPLCAGAMYSPGFFPNGYLCKPFNYGHDMVRALGERFGFDPQTTPWSAMTKAQQEAFLYGDPEPMEVNFQSRTQSSTRTITYPGFYGFIRDWDVGGTYTDTQPCPACQGAKLRPEYLAVTLAGRSIHQLKNIPLAELQAVLSDVDGEMPSEGLPDLVRSGLDTIQRRLRFLIRAGLPYLHLDRSTRTLSAGEAQRIKLAGILGSGLTSLTILLDEPTRGMHPVEVDALGETLRDLRDEGNTVIVIEHDLSLIETADHIVDIGPGAGQNGGRIVAQGTADQLQASAESITGAWLRRPYRAQRPEKVRQPTGEMRIYGARANNLRGDEITIPLGLMVGFCGVSGSGKSTLVVDTLGRALAPKKQTTSVAYEQVDPGEYDRLDGAPARAVLIDQTRAGVNSPLSFLGLERPLRQLYAQTSDAVALGLDEQAFSRSCSVCKGRGAERIDMGFLPPVIQPCETCRGTGFLPEAWDVLYEGITLPDLVSLTIAEVAPRMDGRPELAAPLQAALDAGLGYLALRQPSFALSGGEAQRLKIAKELARKTRPQTLYILDEPTVGLHLEDIDRLLLVLQRLVDEGHSLAVVEHHPQLLAACDWLIELGPGGGPAGGQVIAAGTPQEVAAGSSATAPYLRPYFRE